MFNIVSYNQNNSVGAPMAHNIARASIISYPSKTKTGGARLIFVWCNSGQEEKKSKNAKRKRANS